MTVLLALAMDFLKRFWPYIFGAIAVLGGMIYLYEKGVHDERDRANAAQQKSIQHQEETRTDVEKRNSDLSDDAATQRLRPEPKH